jgi:hypothetical protein
MPHLKRKLHARLSLFSIFLTSPRDVDQGRLVRFKNNDKGLPSLGNPQDFS